MSSKQNVFETLNKIDVSQYTEKKGKFNYLSWSYAVRELLKVCPTATWEVHTFQGVDGTDQPYMKNGTGAYVQVSVNVDDVVRSQIHPVLDNRNQTITDPNAFQINTSIQRCLAKAIALHGLGLYIFAGEDLPEPDALTSKEEDNLYDYAKPLGKKLVDDMKGKVASMEINANNYEACMEKIKQMIQEKEGGKDGK